MRMLIAVIAAILVAGTVASSGWGWQLSPGPGPAAAVGARGIPHDWTHEHLIFSRPRSAGQLRESEREPRFRIQEAWRQRQARAGSVEDQMRSLDALAVQLAAGRPPASWGRPVLRSLPRDWSVNMGNDATVGNGMYPAKFSFGIGPGSCATSAAPDFVVFNTGIAGAAGVSTVLAYDNLYSGCSGTVPSRYWAYNTGTGSVAPTSVVLSGDGSQIAFVQNSSTGAAQLIILKWSKSSTSVTLSNTPAASYRTCGAPCMTALSFTGAHRDSNSSPFYDYDNDVLYVGDDNGSTHKFGHIFLSGTPAEVTTGWPIAVSSGVALSSPVFDSNSGSSGGSGNIFVGNAMGRLNYVRESTSSRGACASGTPPCLGTPSIALGGAIVDGPLVDSGTQRVFWFDGTSPSHGEVVQTDTALGSRITLIVGGGSDSSNMHMGSFDNSYYNSPSNNIMGFLYVCGNNAIYADRPALFRVGFSSSGVMNSTVASGPLTLVNNSFEECSPITEVFNGVTDRIFLSVQANGNLGGTCSGTCTGTGGSCLYSFDITTSFPSTCAARLAVSNSTIGGTSGVIIDNTATSPAGSSQVYFSPLGNQLCKSGGTGGCASQASQAGLN